MEAKPFPSHSHTMECPETEHISLDLRPSSDLSGRLIKYPFIPLSRDSHPHISSYLPLHGHPQSSSSLTFENFFWILSEISDVCPL